MTAPVGEFIWYELVTADAGAACRFYGDLIGWQAQDAGMPGMDYRILNAKDAPIGGVMQLTDQMRDGGARPAWLGYVEVADIASTAQSVEADGGKVIVPATDIPDVGRFAMIEDPQGVPIYVMQSTSTEESRAFAPDADGHCAWNELSTPDPEAALGFYRRQFGWALGEAMPIGELGTYQMFEAAGRVVGGVMRAPVEGPPPMWRYYFRVPRLGPAVQQIESGGGAVLHGPQEVPGDDEILIAADPQGALFALVARRADS